MLMACQAKSATSETSSQTQVTVPPTQDVTSRVEAVLQTQETCVESLIDAVVIRVDTPNLRYFIEGSDDTISNMAINADKIHQCFEQSDWAGKWSLSVFSAAKFAGYKTDDAVYEYLADGSWSKAYLGEFRGATGSLIKNPIISPQQLLPK